MGSVSGNSADGLLFLELVNVPELVRALMPSIEFIYLVLRI